MPDESFNVVIAFQSYADAQEFLRMAHSGGWDISDAKIVNGKGEEVKGDKREELAKTKGQVRSKLATVRRAALLVSAEKLNDDPADPGWQAELYDDQFEEAVLSAGRSIEYLRILKSEIERG